MKLKIKNNVALLNVISNFILQFFTIVSGFILPKLILSFFGSDVNGIVSSLNQFLNYISLLEGGVTGVILANLYKPIKENDEEKISSIITTTNGFYKKIALIFCIYSVLLATIYPLMIKSQFNFIFIFSLTLILAVNLFIQYNFSLSLKNLLIADKKGYIISFFQSFIIVVNLVLSYITLKIYPSIHLFKLISALGFIVQPIFYNYFVKKKFNINYNARKNKKLLKSRWDGFAINIASFIHYNTDIVVLSFFTNFKTVSIYSVYCLVTNGIRQLIFSVSSGISPSIGHLYASGDLEKLNKKFNLYEFIIFILVFFIFSIAGLLITPFVMVYTKNIVDTNYYQPIFGVLIIMAEAIYIIKEPHLNLAYSANKFKDLKKPAYIESLLNIVLSIILVHKYNLIGVAIGTLIAMLYRTIFQVIYVNKNILKRSNFIFVKRILIFSIISFIAIIICKKIYIIKIINIYNWICCGVLYSLIFILLYILMCLLFFKKEIKEVLSYLKIVRS